MSNVRIKKLSFMELRNLLKSHVTPDDQIQESKSLEATVAMPLYIALPGLVRGWPLDTLDDTKIR